MMKKKLVGSIIICGIGTLFLGQSTVSAMEYIPYNYKPYTKIEVVSNGELIETSTSNEDRNYFKQEKTRFDELYKANKLTNVDKKIKAELGYVAYYGSDGGLVKVEKDGIEVIPESYRPYSMLRYYEPPSLPGETYLYAQWGSNNKLYIDPYNNIMYGVGRATTFSDDLGQADIKNYKGSVATKLAYDDVKVNTIVTVTAKHRNGYKHIQNMIKTDAGGMPNAVLDIWKTGVEYWGYTWNKWFSMPDTVTYKHRHNP